MENIKWFAVLICLMGAWAWFGSKSSDPQLHFIMGILILSLLGGPRLFTTIRELFGKKSSGQNSHFQLGLRNTMLFDSNNTSQDTSVVKNEPAKTITEMGNKEDKNI